MTQQILWGVNPSLFLVQATQTVNTEVEETADPQSDLLKAILDKSAAAAESALRRGANPKSSVGKEKMSIHAVRHFDKGVCTLLAKAGTAFGDAANLASVVVEIDNPEAFEWVFEKFQSDAGKRKDFIGSVFGSACGGAMNILEHLVKSYSSDQEFAKIAFIGEHKNNATPYWLNSAFAWSLKKQNEPVFSFFGDPKGVWARHFDAALISFFSNIPQDISPVPFAFLNTMAEKYPTTSIMVNKKITESVWTSALSSSFVQNLILFGCEDPLLKQKMEWGSINFSFKPQNFLDALVFKGHGMLNAFIDDEQGLAAVIHSLKKENALLSFFNNAHQETFIPVLRRHPELATWRDSNNNNLLHYAMAAGSAKGWSGSLSKKFVGDVYKTSPDLFFEANNKGKTPSSVISKEVLAAIEKHHMKKSIKESGVLVDKKAPPLKKRRM